MGFRLYFLVCVAASASCVEVQPESHATFENCPTVSGPSVVNLLDVDNTGVERLVVYFYKAKNSHQILPFIPSREYQECIEDIAINEGEIQHNTLNHGTIRGLFNRSPDKTIRYVLKPPFVVNKSPVNIWAQPWDMYRHHGSQEIDATQNIDETEHDISIDLPGHSHDSPNYAPIVHDVDADKRPDWHIPIEGPNDHSFPWQPDAQRNILPGVIDHSPPYVPSGNDISFERLDGEKFHNLDSNIIEPLRPNDNVQPQQWPDEHHLIKPIDESRPVIRPIENNIITRPHHSDDGNGPGIIKEEIEAPIIRPIENNIVVGPNHPQDPNRPIVKGTIETPLIKPTENNNIIRPYEPDERLRPIERENIEASVITPRDRQFPYLPYTDEIQNQSNLENLSGNNDYNDYGSREDNRQLNIDGGNINPYLPEGDQGNIIHGDIGESLNSQNVDEMNAHISQKHHLNEPSEGHLVYKWSKVRVPHVDISGKVHGWTWKSIRSPVRSKSVKWSYYESSSGKKHRSTHWKHRSSSRIYHHTTNRDISVANFDTWLKNQIRNMKNDGNVIPTNDDYIYTVKVAIENALNTNGIRVKNGGALVDGEGNVLNLNNIQLRPIYIGRSLVHNRIVKNPDNSMNYKIPATTPFLEGLLVSVINPPRSLGIVPLGVTALPRVNPSQDHNIFIGSGRELRPISIRDGLHKIITGRIRGVDEISPRPAPPPKIPVEDSTSLSEEEPEYRIIGGSFAVGSGAPLANKGRSGKD